MATQVQNRRGTTAEHSTFTGAVGELTVDTTKDVVVVHDGSTAGGFPTLRQDQANLPTSAPSNGVYIPSSNNVAISTNGTGRLFVDASGNVGVGTNDTANAFVTLTKQDVSLRLNPVTGAASITAVQTGVAFRDLTIGSNETIFQTSSLERMRLDSSGRLGLGTSSPSNIFHASGTAGTPAVFERTSTTGVFIALKDSATQTFIGNTNGVFSIQTPGSSYSDKLVVTSAGLVGIGTTSPGSPLTIESNAGNQVKITYPSIASYYLNATSGGDFAINKDGTERARIDSSGRLLVGSSSSAGASRLQVLGDSSATTNPGKVRIGTGYTAAAFSGPTELGQVNFGPSDDVTAAQISAWYDVTGTGSTSDFPGRLVFSTTADGASSPTERMRITSGGRIALGGQGTPYAGAICDTYSNILGEFTHVFRQDHASGYGIGIGIDGIYLAYFYPNKDLSGAPVGSISQDGSVTSYNTTSDYRLKENVAPLTDAINRLNQLQVRRFNFIANPGKTVDGFIAHEVQAVVPECVTGTKDEVDDDGNPIYQGIDQSKIVPLLTAALQEALQKIEDLEGRLTAAGL